MLESQARHGIVSLAAVAVLAAGAPRLEYRVEPVYPTLAREARIHGNVVMTALIAPDGRVAALRLVRGHPLLVRSAMNAVKQWRYRPTGEAAITDVVVTFSLAPRLDSRRGWSRMANHDQVRSRFSGWRGGVRAAGGLAGGARRQARDVPLPRS
jgi:TonB family protein